MKEPRNEFTQCRSCYQSRHQPDFDNLLKVLHREKPARATLFEFFLNDDLCFKLAGVERFNPDDILYNNRILITAFKNAGYDYATVLGSAFSFPTRRHMAESDKSLSLNAGAVISDRKSFEDYAWPNPDDFDYSQLDILSGYLPEGMKLIVYSPDGVLENVIGLVGFNNLCYMLANDPELVGEVFDAVGSRLLRYYEICSPFPSVGALISNDDWGFNTQTMLSVGDMRKYVIPWHKKIVETIHGSGKPAILHSCGRLEEVMDDIIDVIGFDAKHSYEDKIIPVELAYEKWGGRIAILGGIDMDFLCRAAPEAICRRSAAMLERARDRGGYALGSGNSIPYYVPELNYFAMISAAGHGDT